MSGVAGRRGRGVLEGSVGRSRYRSPPPPHRPTRLPGFNAEWEVKTLLDLAERKKELFDDGDWIESEHITTEGIRLIQTGNIGVGTFVEKDDKKYIREGSFPSL